MLALGVSGSVILFLVLSLIFFLRTQAPDFKAFHLPLAFWLSTAILLMSSGTMYMLGRAFREEQFAQYRLYLLMTLGLSLAFLGLQYIGWKQLFSIGVGLGQISGAFMYLLSGLHAAHIIGGIVWLGIIGRETIEKPHYVDYFLMSLNPVMKTRIRLLGWYWHFMDGLWVYLFLLFLAKEL